jgi:hypothetical protein
METLTCLSCGYLDTQSAFADTNSERVDFLLRCPVCWSFSLGPTEYTNGRVHLEQECEKDGPTCGECGVHLCRKGRWSHARGCSLREGAK